MERVEIRCAVWDLIAEIDRGGSFCSEVRAARDAVVTLILGGGRMSKATEAAMMEQVGRMVYDLAQKDDYIFLSEGITGYPSPDGDVAIYARALYDELVSLVKGETDND